MLEELGQMAYDRICEKLILCNVTVIASSFQILGCKLSANIQD